MNIKRYILKYVLHGALGLTLIPYCNRRSMVGNLLILTYHSFCSNWPSGIRNSLPIRQFERQLTYLQRRFHILSLEGGLDMMLSKVKCDKPFAAITMDDGFRDNYTHAWPVLSRHNLPATIFLSTDFIDTGRVPWPTRIFDLLDRTKQSAIDFPFNASIDSPRRRILAALRIKKEWGNLNPEERFLRLDELKNHLHIQEEPYHRPLTWDQIREMRSGGISFGSHTVFHSILPATGIQNAKFEIEHSKMKIEQELQSECLSFSYPDGQYDKDTVALVREAGFTYAVTQDNGLNQSSSNRLVLKRKEVPFHDPLPTFRYRTSLTGPGKHDGI